MEFDRGILLDHKFLFWCVRAAFVTAKWYAMWSERTLLVDPMINAFGWSLRAHAAAHGCIWFSECYRSETDGVPQAAVDGEIDDSSGASGAASLEPRAS